MAGDNPGIYANVEQTEWWPFIPALGVLVGVCLAVTFILTTVMAIKREGSVCWAAVSGLIAMLMLCLSIFGCVVAASQYEHRERQHHEIYLTQVASWVSDEIDEDVTVSDAARLLGGESVTMLVGGKLSSLYILQDRSSHLLQLVVL